MRELSEEDFRAKLGSIVIQARRVTMSASERKAAAGQDFSFDELAKHMLHREDKDQAIRAKYELDVVMNHEDVDRRLAKVPNAFVIPDEIINRMSLPGSIGGREKLAITSTGAASSIEEAVDYGRSQMALYDRVPLFQYCDEMPNQVGNAKIPIWTAGPTVGRWNRGRNPDCP